MSHAKRFRNGNKLPPFVALPWAMLNSPAYKSLKHSAAKALPYFWGKPHKRFDDPEQYTTEIHFPYAEGQRYGFAPGTFSKVICDLVEKGFIDPVDKGGLRGFGKSWNVFKISVRWERYGTSKFQALDWRCFLPRPRLKDTSKKETYNIKKGNETVGKSDFVSLDEAVEDISA